ncbi:ArnT family glycosyltransferase [Patescibacteria group bacterium]
MTRKTLKIINFTLLVLIIIGAFWVRSFNIENAPSGIYPDEAENGMDAYIASQTGTYELFYTGNNGREGLYINLQALGIKLFGTSMLSLKLWSIIFGTLTVYGTYLLTKQLFRSARSGLITAYLVAFSFWSINFSRIGFRAIMLPAVITFSAYFLFRGIRTKKYIHFISAGLIFGIGLHTYIAFRITPAILFILFIALWITKKDFIKDYWKQALIFIMAAFITMAPMINDFYQNPEHLGSRAASISILNPEVNQGHLVKIAIENIGLSLAKYTFWGDPNWRHNYPPYPVLHPLLGITFIIGLIYIIIKFFHLLHLRFKHKIRDRKLYVYSFILAWFFGMLAPEFLSVGLPHSLRAIGTLPVTYIIATVPILWILGKVDQLNYTPKLLTYSVIIILLASIGVFNTVKYHVFWANNENQYISFDKYLKEISDYTKNLPASTEKYIVADQYTSLPIRFLNADVEKMNYVWDVHVPYISPKDNDFVIIMTHPEEKIHNQVLEKFPDIKEVRSARNGGGYFIEFTYRNSTMK